MLKINMSELAKKHAKELGENWLSHMCTWEQIDKDVISSMDAKGYDLILLAKNSQHEGFEWKKRV